MAQDATGAPTSLGIPLIDPDVDAPSGLGTNAGFEEVDTLLVARDATLATHATEIAALTPATNGAKVWNGTGWEDPSGTPDGTKFLRDDGTWAAIGVSTAPQVQVSYSAALASGVNRVVPFTSEDFDTDAMHDTVTNNTRITINTAGTYLIWGSVDWFNSLTGTRNAVITKNGGGVAYGGTQLVGSTLAPNDSSYNWFASGTVAVVLAANDYLELTISQTSGGSITPSVKFGALRIG